MTARITPEEAARLLAEATPGPWAWIGDLPIVLYSVPRQHEKHAILAPHNAYIAKVDGDGSYVPLNARSADAKIIAAAPDLARAYIDTAAELERLIEERDALRADVERCARDENASTEEAERLSEALDEARAERDRLRDVVDHAARTGSDATFRVAVCKGVGSGEKLALVVTGPADREESMARSVGGIICATMSLAMDERDVELRDAVAERDRLARILAVERGDESAAPEGWRYVQCTDNDMGRWRGPGVVSVERWGRGCASWLLRVGSAGYGFEHALIAMESPYATEAADAARGEAP